ncbi:MAG TPA: hypothetical protein VI541_00665, partial [Actinomycetota bacterium]|nr:hypothetical protein [Actinomycetota bacterium]
MRVQAGLLGAAIIIVLGAALFTIVNPVRGPITLPDDSDTNTQVSPTPSISPTPQASPSPSVEPTG